MNKTRRWKAKAKRRMARLRQQHVHTATCFRAWVAEVTLQTASKTVTWAISVSMCPLAPDTDETVRRHVAAHYRGGVVRKVQFVHYGVAS